MKKVRACDRGSVMWWTSIVTVSEKEDQTDIVHLSQTDETAQ